MSLSSSTTNVVDVLYSTANNTAVAGSDYGAIASTKLTFVPGETSKTITVSIINDTAVESNETFFVNLISPTNATISDGQGIGTITDDDAAPVTPLAAPLMATLSVATVASSFSDVNEVVSVNEDTVLSGSVLTGTTSTNGPITVTNFQVAGDTTVFTAGQTATIAGVGTLKINTDGSYNFTPASNYNGTVPVATYTVSDGSGSDTSTIAITVTPVVDGFTDKNESAILDTGATSIKGSVLTGTSSVDGAIHVTTFTVAGDTKVFTVGETASMTGVGTLLINADGSYAFTPATNYTGTVPVATYTMSDGFSTDTSTLNININHGPVAAHDIAATMVGVPVTLTSTTLLINDSDPDGDPLTLFSVQDANHGSVAMVGSDVIFTPTAGYTGAASFNYTISDGHGGTATTTVDVNVNASPVAVGDVVSGTANTPLTIASTTLLSNDSDPNGDPLTISSVLDATHGTVALVGGSVVFTPTKDYIGDASFTYTISDGHGGSASASVSLTIAADLLKAGTTPIP